MQIKHQEIWKGIEMPTEISNEGLDLQDLAAFFGMELGRFFKSHAVFFNFFQVEGKVDFPIARKHLIATGRAITLKQSVEVHEGHPQLCCVTGLPICMASNPRVILLDAIRSMAESGLEADDSNILHSVYTSGRNCCLIDDLTFRYLLFTLCQDQLIIFKRNDSGERIYQIAPVNRKRVGRPRKFDL